MGIIRLLDTVTTNKIAAGEVVSDPASVVKELMENSLDAGSTRITVEITRGGISLIKVADNGCGIAPEDMEAAFIRHATSKIKEFKDLDTIATMGFRGEALPSIAAVSKVTLTSRLRGNYEGFRLTVDSGKPGKPIAVGCAEGTTVEVADLFYNVPARRKFLKSPGKETAAANEVVTRIALGNPQTGIKLKNNNNIIFETYGKDDLLSTIRAVLGKDISEHLIPVGKNFEDWSIYGFVSNPFYTRSSRKFQYFYVNRRWVANKSLRYVLDHAYRTLVPKGRYPIAVLFLDTKKPLIDVNVDPTKNTIRIKDEKKVLDFIIEAVRDSLLKNRDNKSTYSPDLETVVSRRDSYKNIVPSQAILREISVEAKQQDANAKYVGSKTIDCTSVGEHFPANICEDIHPCTERTEEERQFNVLAQLAGMYILYEKENNLYIVDQHAAHERIRYENIKKRAASEAQQLIIPQTVSITPRQATLLEQLAEDITRAGFHFEHFGGNYIVLRELPVELASNNPEAAFLELLELIDSNLGSVKDIGEAFLISLACTTAVKGGQILTVEEMEAIIEELSLCQNPLTCPHGRPTTICISEEMLLREFKRT